MNNAPITADLQALSRLLDQGLELTAEALEPWLAGLTDEERHFVPRLRGMLTDHLRGSRSGFMAACPKLDDAAGEAVASPGDMAGPYRPLPARSRDRPRRHERCVAGRSAG